MAAIQNKNTYVKFVRGTRKAWDSLTPAQITDDTLYFIYETPDASTGVLYLGDKQIGGTNGTVEIPANLRDLHDLNLDEIIPNGDILVYDASSSKWINSSLNELINIDELIKFNELVFDLDKNNLLTLYGFEDAEAGTIPQKNESGSISWIQPGNLETILNIQEQIDGVKENQLTEVKVKTLISEEVAKIDRLSYEKVENLNDALAKLEENKIYLVPAEGSTDNKYDEYMTIDGKLEPVGSFTADLDDYVTVTTFNSTVGNLEEAIGKNTQDISTLNGLVATTKTNLETLTTEVNNFKSVVGDLSAFTAENTLVEQVNHLTEQLKWQEIVIEE